MNRQKLPITEKIGYALGDTATNLVWRTLMVFLPIFYTDVFGLSAAAVGTLLLVCRYWDGVTDFLMGLIADRTNTRWGKFRPWVLWSAVPFGVMTVLTFTAFDLGPAAKLIYAYVTYSLLIVAFTASNVPYSALTGVLTDDPIERTSVSSFRFFFAFLGGLITQGLNIPLVAYFGGGNDIKGYTSTMLLFSAISVVLFVITFATTKERVRPCQEQPAPLREDVIDLLRNKPWLILFCVGLLFVTLATLKQGVTMFYFKYYVQSVNLAAIFMTTGLLASMLGTVLTPWLTGALGKRRLLQLCFLLTGLSSAALFTAASDDIALIFSLSTITELSSGPIVALFFAMLGDAADHAEWEKGRRATGLVFSAGSISFKFGTGVAGAITGWVLTLVGYVANAPQSEEALVGIRLLMSVFPAAAAFLGFGVLRWYPLREATLDQIQRELYERRLKKSAAHLNEGRIG